MSGVNKAIVVGHLGKDPELRSLSNGDSVVSFSVATSENYTDKSGQKVESTEWHRVKAFGKTADNAAKFLKKGSQVYVEGKLKTNKWTDANVIEKYSTEINVQNFQLLDKKEGGAAQPASNAGDYAKASQGGGLGSLDDDVPF